MRFRLRTLLILMATLPPVCGAVPWLYRELDPTVAATLTIWLIIGVGLACVAVARLDRTT